MLELWNGTEITSMKKLDLHLEKTLDLIIRAVQSSTGNCGFSGQDIPGMRIDRYGTFTYPYNMDHILWSLYGILVQQSSWM